MDLLEDPTLPHLLKRLNNNDYKKFKGFMWNGGHIAAVVRYLRKLHTVDKASFDPLYSIEKSRNSATFPGMVLSFIDNCLKKCFNQIPDPKTFANFRANELIVTFLDFLLDVAAEVGNCSGNLLDPIEGEIEDLGKKLKFLITVLNDAPFRVTTSNGETSNILGQLEGFAREVGDFFYLYFFTDESLQSRIDLPLRNLLGKFELVEAKIKEHCAAPFPYLQSSELSDKGVDSLFIVNSLINDLDDMLNRDFGSGNKLHVQIKALKDELGLAMEVLRGVKGRHFLPEAARKIRDVAYEAEYIINSLVVGELPFWYLSLRLPNIIEKVKAVTIGFQEIKFMGSFQVGDIPLQYLIPRPNHAKAIDIGATQTKEMKKKVLSADEIVVGFQKEAEQIIEQLIYGPKQLRAILILGMAGLGKTTLAHKIFDDPNVSQHFDKRAWCIASQSHHTKSMLIDIFSFIGHRDLDRMHSLDTEQLGHKLYQALIGRRYLVVIDDVWAVDALQEIKRFLPEGHGSRILITCRNRSVAPRDSIVHQLPFRTKEQCWDLLQQKVYLERKQKCPEELVGIGKQIAAHCKGLPLAVVVIASVLADKKNEKKLWAEVAQTLNSQISKDLYIYRILEISYKHLPEHLRPCFLYFGAFQEDREIPVRKITSLWISEGFVVKEENKSLMDVAEEYLSELLSRSLIWVSKRRSNHGAKTCGIHDLMRNFCLWKAKEENFLNVINDRFSVYERHHRLCISPKLKHVGSLPLSPHIRSWLGQLLNVPSVFSRAKLLRVLDSFAVEHSVDSKMQELDLTGIEQLIHLRYIDVRINAEAMPASIGCLNNLEYLHLHSSQPLKIPNSLLNLQKLRHLQIKTHAVFDESCHNIAVQMRSLERISTIHIIHEDDEKILTRSPNLSSLKCATKPLWDSSEKCHRYLALNDFVNLKSLNVTYLGNEFIKDTMSFPSNLVKLTLDSFKLSRGEISMIGKLQKLEILKLQYVVFDGKEWKTNDGEFRELKFLKLESLRIHRWNTSKEHFPKLRQLILLKCWKLKRFPASLGDISSLQMVSVSFCSKGFAESAERVQKEMSEMGSDLTITIS